MQDIFVLVKPTVEGAYPEIAKKRKFAGGPMLYSTIRAAKAARTNTGRTDLKIIRYKAEGYVDEPTTNTN